MLSTSNLFETPTSSGGSRLYFEKFSLQKLKQNLIVFSLKSNLLGEKNNFAVKNSPNKLDTSLTFGICLNKKVSCWNTRCGIFSCAKLLKVKINFHFVVLDELSSDIILKLEERMKFYPDRIRAKLAAKLFIIFQSEIFSYAFWVSLYYAK